jgi:hypothetical protein
MDLNKYNEIVNKDIYQNASKNDYKSMTDLDKRIPLEVMKKKVIN